jgi:hypothetical protein
MERTKRESGFCPFSAQPQNKVSSELNIDWILNLAFFNSFMKK